MRGCAVRKASSLTLLLAFLALPAWPSEGGRAAPRRPSQEPLEGVIISPRLLFRDIALSLRDGTVVRGRLSGATTRSVRLRQAGEDSDFAYEDIRKAAVRSESRLSKGVLPGVVLGLYAGNAALAVNTSRPGFYLSHIDQHEMTSWWLFFGEAVFAAIGGGIGWLVSSRSETAVFDFPADPDESRFVQERFIRFLGGEEAPSRVHLFIQNGQLIPGASGRFESSLLEAGFSPSY